MKDRVLVICTLIIACLAIFYVISHEASPKYKNIDTRGQLTIGNPSSDVHVIVFSDFRCSACRYYEKQMYPLIKRRYINTGKISYTLIPIAFLKGSAHLLEGYYCTRSANSALSEEYIDEVFDQQSLPILPGVNKDRLYKCLGSEDAADYVHDNLSIAEDAMGRNFVTPTVFVNGYRVPKNSYTAISNAIDTALQGEP